ncbi:molecular chaperone HtpG [bacterium AH-315-C20]|nr:molecular chaperone HtpG [bacterium AH-315-C20]
MATKGTVNVQTENIFPLIKKFLYSDHEIFLRELISNAVDATSKLNVVSQAGDVKGDLGDLTIEVELDKKAGTLIVRDKGVGMTEEEIDKYINEIAFSGAEEFVKKYEGKEGAEQIIGHFGLGFYSSFMVSENVQIRSLSYKKKAQAVQWESSGTPEFEIKDIEKDERGTEVILHISKDSKEFLEKGRIEGILKKYCKFLPVNIKFGTKSKFEDDPTGEKDEDGNVKRVEVEIDNIINNTNPAWIQTPKRLKDEDYKSFYRELYPGTLEDPLFHIHLNVDYPFNLTGILYFPRLRENIEVQKNKIQLYSNQVFITDSVEEIVPEFLTLLHGVLDSPDIPLNVSRSYLQADANVKKISAHITKKVAAKLAAMFKKDREDFESKWDDLKVFVEYGMLTEDKFYDKAEKFALFKNTKDEYYTIEDYLKKIKTIQTDKNDKLVILYAHSKDAQHSFVSGAEERGFDVLVFDSPLTPHYIQKLESKLENVSFARVDSDTIDNLIRKDDDIPSKLSEEEQEKLKPVFEEVVSKEKFTIQFEKMSETDPPIVITQPEFMRRMQEQQKMGGGGGMYGAFPEMYSLAVNVNHPVIGAILKKQKANREKTAKQLCDLAMLSQGMLSGEELTEFINRSVEIMK